MEFVSAVVRKIDAYPLITREEGREFVAPYDMATSLLLPPNPDSVSMAWSDRRLPEELLTIWSECDGAKVLYSEGSAGLLLYGPEESRRQTDATLIDEDFDDDFYRVDDIVVGRFQGFDTKLVYSQNDGWMTSGSIDVRSDWVRLGTTLDRFLEVFLRYGGTDTDWEREFI